LQAIFPSTSSYRLQASSYLFAAFAFFATTVLAAELLARTGKHAHLIADHLHRRNSTRTAK
jgi:hypothetical protein